MVIYISAVAAPVQNVSSPCLAVVGYLEVEFRNGNALKIVMWANVLALPVLPKHSYKYEYIFKDFQRKSR